MCKDANQKKATELLDDAFQAVHNTRGMDASTQAARANRQIRRDAMVDMMAALTGRHKGVIYEQYTRRLAEHVESAIAAQEG